jgi:cytochrome oxidase assembly protein ShyY1
MKKFWQWLATALLVAIFLSLANWQWNRAVEIKKPIAQDQSISPIDSLISPNGSIEPSALGQKVSLEGEYISNWVAPHQDGNKSWAVGLFQTSDNAAILIVRGIKGANDLALGKSKIVGYIMPPQSENRAENTNTQISRVDSSLFVSKINLPLYAPYIQVISEDPATGLEVLPFKASSKVPGFYWQHISYVVIWFLFAITAIYLMIYQRRLDKVEP